MNLTLKLSLRPLQPSTWKTHEPTGAEFLIAALPSVLDDQLADEVIAEKGKLDGLAFAHKVAPHVIKGWRHIGDAGAEAAATKENIEVFVDHHGNSIMPWIIRQARSLEHYMQKETTAAKNG